MSKQICVFAQTAEKALSDMILSRNSAAVVLANLLSFSTPVVVSGVVVNVTVRSGSGYIGVVNTGQQIIQYARADLAQYFQGITPELDASKGLSKHALLVSLFERYGLYFAAVVTGNGAYSAGSFTFSGSTATLAAAATNLLWQGSVNFNLTQIKALLDLLPATTLTDPSLTGIQVHAEAYYGDRFDTTGFVGHTPVVDLLSELEVGLIPTPSGATWDLGTALTGDPWVWNASTDAVFNAAGATVVYNGNSTGEWTLSDQTDLYYTNVCVIELSSRCLNLSGYLVIPYNYTMGGVSPSP